MTKYIRSPIKMIETGKTTFKEEFTGTIISLCFVIIPLLLFSCNVTIRKECNSVTNIVDLN